MNGTVIGDMSIWYEEYPHLEEWLHLWREDTTKAIGNLSLSEHKESIWREVPIQWVMIRDGIIKRSELESAVVAWLSLGHIGRGPNPESTYQKMCAVMLVIVDCSLENGILWFIEHFDEMRKLFPSRFRHYKLWRRKVVETATSGAGPHFSNHRLKIRPQMLKILDSKEFDSSFLLEWKTNLELMFRDNSSRKKTAINKFDAWFFG